MTYDDWKASNPNDAMQRDPPCVETPKYDDYDICVWCGAGPDDECKNVH